MWRGAVVKTCGKKSSDDAGYLQPRKLKATKPAGDALQSDLVALVRTVQLESQSNTMFSCSCLSAAPVFDPLSPQEGVRLELPVKSAKQVGYELQIELYGQVGAILEHVANFLETAADASKDAAPGKESAASQQKRGNASVGPTPAKRRRVAAPAAVCEEPLSVALSDGITDNHFPHNIRTNCVCFFISPHHHFFSSALHASAHFFISLAYF